MRGSCSRRRQLGEAQAIRLAHKIAARHPAGYPLRGLLQLQLAADRYGWLIRYYEHVTFEEWARRIDADAAAGVDPDRVELTAALRGMHLAAQLPDSGTGHLPRAPLMEGLRLPRVAAAGGR